jgi:hypothetical protein
MSEESKRRTKRRYAHELHPHGDEWEVRPLEVEVPYLYARALGFDVQGTSWFDSISEVTGTRTMQMLDARHIALMADAMHQGLTGQEAWAWAEKRMDESGKWVYERAVHYGGHPGPDQALPLRPRTRPSRPLRARDEGRMADGDSRSWTRKRMRQLHRTNHGGLMKFKLGDTVRVINERDYYFDRVGRITSICKSGEWPHPFHVSGMHNIVPLWFGPHELILADPLNVMLNDPEGQRLVQAIHDRKGKAHE